MTGDWKPGDLAIVDYGTGSEVMMRDHWGWWSATTELSDSDDAVESIGPLAVIDPEDRQAVKRLARRQQDFYYDSGSTPTSWDELSGEQRQAVVEATHAALREFAAPTPPRPNEPKGLGAVVECGDGAIYIRVSHHLANPWTRAAFGDFVNWDAFTAVRVLSEGIEQP